MSAANGDGRLLTAAEVGELLAVPETWIYQEARADRIPHIRVGRYVRFRREAVEAWIADLERTPAPGQRPGGFPQ